MKRFDHIVAITPCIWISHVGLFTTGLGIASHIEPVPSPMLAVLLGCQKLIDQTLDRILRTGLPVSQELRTLLRARRQTSKIKCQSTHKRIRVAIFVGLDLLLFPLRNNVTIDGCVSPILIFINNRFDLLGLNERPKGLALLDIFSRHLRVDHRALIHTWIGCSHLDPRLKIGDHRRRQFTSRRHTIVAIVDRMPKNAVLQIPRYNRCSRFTTGQERVAIIDRQSTAHRLLAGRVTTITILDEHRANLRFKEIELLGG